MKKWHLIVLTAALTLVAYGDRYDGTYQAQAASEDDPDPFTFTGATPEQEAILREIAAWPGVPALARPINIVIGEGYPNHGGATGITLNSYLPSVDHIGTAFLHEYGHVYDYHFLSAADREAIISLHNMPYSWRTGPYMERPSERFAGTFAKIAMASEGYMTNTPFEEIVPPFTDIGDKSQEMQDAITWLYNQGITKGTTFSTYGPDEFVTRGQMALFLQRALDN